MTKHKYAIYLNSVFMSVVIVPSGLGAKTKPHAVEVWKARPVVLGTYGDKPYEGTVTGKGFTITAKRKGIRDRR